MNDIRRPCEVPLGTTHREMNLDNMRTNRNMKKYTVLISLLILTAALYGCSDKDSGSLSPESLFSKTCSECHKLKKVEDYSGDMTWSDVLVKMRTERKLEISDESAEIIIGYLNETFPPGE